MRARLLSLALLPSALCALSCSSSDSGSPGASTPAEPAFNLSGDCQGEAQSTVYGVSNTFSAHVVQTHAAISGTINIPGIGISGAAIQGNVDGDRVKFGDVEGTISFDGKATNTQGLPDNIQLGGGYQYPKLSDQGSWTATCQLTATQPDAGDASPGSDSGSDSAEAEASAPMCARVAVIKSTMAHDLAIDGTTLYIADETEGLKIVDASNAFAPKQRAVLALPDGQPIGIAKLQNSVFIVNHKGALVVVDVANPDSPAVVATLVLKPSSSIPDPPPGPNGAIAIADSHVFVSGVFGMGLCVVDGADPKNPKLVGSCTDSVDESERMIAGSGFLYTESMSEFSIVNIQTPDSVVSLGSVSPKPGALPGSFGMIGDYALLSTGEVVSVASPATPSVVATVSIDSQGWPVTPFAAAVSGSYGFLAEGTRIHVVDLQQPSAPTLVGQCDSGDSSATSGRLFVSGARAYLAGDAKGVSVWQVYAPAND